MNQQNKWQQDLDKLTDQAFKQTDSELFNLYRDKLIEIKKSVKYYTDIYPSLSFSKKLEIERQLQVGTEIQQILSATSKDAHHTIENYATNQGELGYNGVFYAIEGAENVTLPFTLINHDYIVKALNKPVTGKRLSKRLYQNQDHLAKVSTQALIDGLWDGNGYPEIAKRITDQAEASYKQALRIARTEGGRVRSLTTQKGYDHAADLGIDFDKQWLATSDNRTRHDHTELNGQTVAHDGQFEIRGNHADGPRLFGAASEDINCRCTTITKINDMPAEYKNKDKPAIEHSSFQDWLKQKMAKVKSNVPHLSDKDLIDKYLNQSFVDNLSTKRSKELARRMHKAPDNMKQMWAVYSDKMDFESVNPEGHGSYYRPSTHKVTTTFNDVDGVKSAYYLNNYDVVYHEFGHMIDHAAGRGSGGNLSALSDYGMGVTMRDDYKNYCKNVGAEITKTLNIADMEHYSWNPENVYYYHNLKLKLTKTGKLDATSQRKLGEQQLTKELQKANDWPTYGDLSDMIEAATNGRIQPGIGHGKKYWSYYGMQETEAFAEMTSATINNPASLEIIKKIFPNGYEQYLKMVSDIIEVGKIRS